MKTKHFQLTEVYRGDKPHIVGTIPNVVQSQAGEEAFNVRFDTAVGEHFDLMNHVRDEIPFEILFDDEFDKLEITIEDDGMNYIIVIEQTWMY